MHGIHPSAAPAANEATLLPPVRAGNRFPASTSATSRGEMLLEGSISQPMRA